MADVGLALERAENNTDDMKARSQALDELMEAGTLEDITSRGQDKVERELSKISMESNIESELAKLRAKAGKGEGE